MKGTALAIDQGEFTSLISGALRRAFGEQRSGVKRLAQAANANVRAAQNWLDGRNTPDALHLLRVAQSVPEVKAEIRRLMAMDSEIDPEIERDLMNLWQTIQRRRSVE